MQNILITGASGFIGSRFLQQALQFKWFGNANIHILSSQNKLILGCRVITYKTHNFNKSILPNSIIYDYVFHIGAFTPKSAPEANHQELSTSNIIFTQSLLNALSSKCKKIIYLSTIDIYSSKAKIISEKSLVKPASLYGYSKLYCEKLIETWAVNENCNYQILRIGHIYGPGEGAYRKVIPSTIQQIINGNKPELWGEGNEKRAFLYIDDCTKSIYRISLLNKVNKVINVISNNSLTIKDLVFEIMQLCGTQVEVMQHPSKFLPRDYIFDNSNMKKILGNEEMPLRDGLKAEIEYFQKLKNCQN